MMRVVMWAASAGHVVRRWHVVRGAGGVALWSACGEWVFGPVDVRRSVSVPVEAGPGDVCESCAAWAGVVVPGSVVPLGELVTARHSLLQAALDSEPESVRGPVPVLWPTEDPDVGKRPGSRDGASPGSGSPGAGWWRGAGGRHRLRRPCGGGADRVAA